MITVHEDLTRRPKPRTYRIFCAYLLNAWTTYRILTGSKSVPENEEKKKIRETLLVLSPTTIPFFFVANRTPVLFTHSTLWENGRHCQLKRKSWLIKPIMLFPFPLAIFSSAANVWPRSGQWDRKEGQLRVSRKDFFTLEKEALEELMSFHLGCFYIWMWCLGQLQPFETWRKPARG